HARFVHLASQGFAELLVDGDALRAHGHFHDFVIRGDGSHRAVTEDAPRAPQAGAVEDRQLPAAEAEVHLRVALLYQAGDVAVEDVAAEVGLDIDIDLLFPTAGDAHGQINLVLSGVI